MKILHCSDLHIGQSFFGFDRYDEHKAVLKFIADVARQNSPDVLIISGDIFDSSQPSASSQRLLVEGLMEIRRSSPDMKIIAIAGNHDSGAGHESHKALWQSIGCEMIGTIHRQANPSDYIIKIPDKGYVCAIPYSAPRNLPPDFFSLVSNEVMSMNSEGLPVVLAAHLSVEGSDFSGHERFGKTIGGIDAIPLAEMAMEFDYIALGHIHRPQIIKCGKHIGSYSGSPLQVSFDEEFEHSISLVSITEHGNTPEIQQIPVPRLRPLVSIPAFHSTPEEALEALQKSELRRQTYIRIKVKTAQSLPLGFAEEIRKICKDKGYRFCLLHTLSENPNTPSNQRKLTVTEFRESTPVSIARRYFNDTGIAFDEELELMLKEICNENETPHS